MTDKKDIYDFFDDLHIVEDSQGRMTVRKDDMVLQFYLRDLSVFGYDAYLEEIKLYAEDYVKRLQMIADSLNDILADEQQVVRERVINRIKHAAPYTGKSALIRSN